MKLPVQRAKIVFWLALAALLLLPFVTDALLGRGWVRIADFAMLYIMLALGLNIVVGYAGLLDLGYIAFFAVGAYCYALTGSPHLALAIMAGLMVVVHRTRLGRAMRAVAENQHAAQLMGVDINRVISITFMLGSALAAVAGLMVSANYGLAHYYMGFLLGLKAFTAAVMGGIGNLRGAMLGGLLLGLIESLGAGYIGDMTGGFLGSNYQDVFAFFVLIAVLVFRPSGLLG